MERERERERERDIIKRQKGRKLDRIIGILHKDRKIGIQKDRKSDRYITYIKIEKYEDRKIEKYEYIKIENQVDILHKDRKI